MKKQYDFSKAEQGRFHRPVEELEIPIYLEKEVMNFFAGRASAKKIKLDTVINTILRKQMEALKKI
jgi:hypothetical protein